MSPTNPHMDSWSPLPTQKDPKTRLGAYHSSSSGLRPSEYRLEERMPPLLKRLVPIVVASMVTLGIAAAVLPHAGMPCHGLWEHHNKLLPEERPLSDASPSSFLDMLHWASTGAYHGIFSKPVPKQYKQGVSESRHGPLEAVHTDDAGLATNLVPLGKRQNNSTDTARDSPTDSPTSNPGSPSNTPTDEPTTNTVAEMPTNTPPTPTPTPTITTTTEPELKTDSTDPEPSASNTLNTPSEEETPEEPPSIATGPPSSSEQSPSSSSSLSSTSASAKPSTDATEISPTTRSTPVRTTTSPIVATFTSTQPNGDVALVTTTSFVVVDASPTPTGADGTLQTGSPAHGQKAAALPALAGAVIGGLFLV